MPFVTSHKICFFFYGNYGNRADDNRWSSKVCHTRGTAFDFSRAALVFIKVIGWWLTWYLLTETGFAQTKPPVKKANSFC